jgi:putative copper export protein
VYRLSDALRTGSYTATWRTAGDDGHVVQGTLRFLVEFTPVSAPVPAEAPVLVAGTPQMAPHTESPRDLNLAPWSVALRWVNFVAVLLCIGGVFYQALLDRVRSTAADPAAWYTTMVQAARRLALIGAGLGLLLLVPRLLVQSVALQGSARGFDPGSLFAMIRETNFGRGWLFQLVGLIGFLIAVLIARPGMLLNWGVGGVAALFLATAPALSGHAAATQGSLLVAGEDIVHVLAAGSWLGTLAYVLLAATRSALRPPDEQAATSLSVLVRTFSPLALICASILLLTGVLSAVSHLSGVSDLWASSYGRALSIKVLVVLLVLSAGFYNWRRVRPALGTTTATLRFQRSATVELALAVVVIGLTAVLVALPTP